MTMMAMTMGTTAMMVMETTVMKEGDDDEEEDENDDEDEDEGRGGAWRDAPHLGGSLFHVPVAFRHLSIL